MHPLIVITGTPGTGKSTLAKKIARKLGFNRLDLHHHYPRLAVGYNHKKKCYDINLLKFSRLVKEKLTETKKGLIVDSHIAHLLPRRLVTLCLVVTCPDLKQLQKRLQKRNYSPEKISENLEAEIFQVCQEEAEAKRHRIVVMDTSLPSAQKMKKVLDALKKPRKSL